MIPAELLELLRCPACYGELAPDATAFHLRCRICGKSFRVEEGIPVMMVNEEPEQS